MNGDPHRTVERASAVIALVPVFPPLYLLAFYGLRFIRQWNRTALGVFAVFLGSQLLAAAFSPSPLLSMFLASARGAFILALLTTGAWLGSTRRLYPLLFGLTVVYITALFTSYFLYGPDILNLRLKHPYYTEVSLGLAGTVGLLLVATWYGGNRWLRLGLGALALTVLALSGSRGALAGLIIGAVGGVLVGSRQFVLPILSGLGLLGIAAVLRQEGFAARALERMFSFGLSGRGRIWHEAWITFLTHPVGGVGPYRLGLYLKSIYLGQCQLWPVLEHLGLQCPSWLKPFSSAWIIGHNIALHQLGETGVLGTVGLFVLMALIGAAVLKTKNPLVTATFLTYLTLGLVDVPIAVPSLHLAEFFWLTMGISLGKAGFYYKPHPSG